MYTAITPGCARAASTSTDFRVPCAFMLRTNATCSIPGRFTSSTNIARPVSRRASSLRRMRRPKVGGGISRLRRGKAGGFQRIGDQLTGLSFVFDDQYSRAEGFGHG